ncbi:MAG TPA: phosphotransferase family protein [Amnibacterium sp.]|uniref:phosphotransferase family protein n=1 Tax=Amnibacterium sp. TaxID=1872496 RepID=UPI002F9211A3
MTGPVPGLDVAALAAWLDRTHPELAGDGLTATVLAGGRSNLTYRLDGTRRDGAPAPLVLRRPPLAHVQATAHDMRREFRAISGLAGTAVPVPAAIDLVAETQPDTGVDAPFYLMEHVDGLVVRSPGDDAALDAPGRRAVAFALIDVLAALHTLDPDAVGLGTLGRPEGYLARQVARWTTQYAGSRTRELPDLDALASALAERVPPTAASGLLHGDFRLDNAILTPDGAGGASIAAVLDWEMATIGDVLADLTLCTLYWRIGAIAAEAGAPFATAVVPGAGYPDADELVEHYVRVTGAAVADLGWYDAFAAFKLAVILEGVHARYLQGATVGAGFESIGTLVPLLAAHGRTRFADQD